MMKCAQCGFENDPDAEFCEQCGSPLARTCPQCGSPVKPGAKFCKKCGTSLAAPPPSSETIAKDKTPSTTHPAPAVDPFRTAVPGQPAYSAPETDVLRPAGPGQAEPLAQEAANLRLAALRAATPSALQDKMRAVSSQIEGERKPVTILFTDIVGSTSLAEKLDPEEWKEIVAGAHQRVSEAVYRYEGTIAQLLGDGVLAFFGAPITHEDDPIRAVKAALDIQKAVRAYEHELEGYLDSFQMRIGINTGTVVVGAVGSDLHMEYLAVGDVVNLAARLQSAARPGTVLVSESTARLIKASFDLQDLGKIEVKGKAEAVSVFEVLKVKPVPESGRGFEELHSPLVGRAADLAVLEECITSLASGHGQIVSVLGEAGIGKTRLAEEACRWYQENQLKIQWIEGRALSYGQGLSFWIITQLLFSDLGLSDGDPEARIRAALKKRVTELFGKEASEALPYLLHLAGVRLEGDQARQISLLDGETLKRQTVLTLTRYFEHLALKEPLVVVFEDLHWADPSSLEVLDQLLVLTDRVPLMLVLLTRMERELPFWQIIMKAGRDYAHRYSEIALKPLSSQEQNQLVDNLLALARLPEPVRQMILDRSEGNPFYLEEVVRSLIDQGAIVHRDGSWQPAGNIANISIPTTLQGVLLARIDRLQEDVRCTLQLASVIGKSFLYRLLESIGEAEHELDRHLALLQRADLVREKSRKPELEYIFKHSLTQEAAYNSLLLERRREFHNKVGEALEALFADRKEQFLGLLAHHFEAAGDQEKASVYLIQAGDQAKLSDEHAEAIGFYERALKLLESMKDEPRAGQVWLKLGLIYNTNFQFEASHQAYETAFQLQQKIRFSEPQKKSKELKGFQLSVDSHLVTLDPGKAKWADDIEIIRMLFSGLSSVNEEMDVIPEMARSWQVLDDGRRYLFHLRDDFTWSDGTSVTAMDFEWAWKRNLNPATGSDTASALYDIVGAREYNLGTNPDSDSVGVHALDAGTLEVLLLEPVAYFPFIITMPAAYPLPRQAIERYGEDWWKPGHILTNGAFLLDELDPQRFCAVQLSPAYPRLARGNVGRIEWTVINAPKERLRAYQENSLDIFRAPFSHLPDGFPRRDIVLRDVLLTFFLFFNPHASPLDDPRVRKAIGHVIDRQKLFELFHIPVTHGGLIPPGMPGHSPEIGLPYDVELGRKLLAEAGYPGGRGFPAITAVVPSLFADLFSSEFQRQWREALGIEVNFQAAASWSIDDWSTGRLKGSAEFNGWLADYPDPDNFLRQSEPIAMLKFWGWQESDYDRLVEQAARTSDRARRMAMYRQADRFLVQEQALIIPISYGISQVNLLIKPWVKNFRPNLSGTWTPQDIFIEDH